MVLIVLLAGNLLLLLLAGLIVLMVALDIEMIQEKEYKIKEYYINVIYKNLFVGGNKMVQNMVCANKHVLGGNYDDKNNKQITKCIFKK